MLFRSLRLAARKARDPFAYQARTLEQVAARAHEFDIIHNHYDYPLLALARMTSTPVVTTLHSRLDNDDLAVALESFPTAPLVSISHAQRAPLEHLNWVATVHHGIDLEALRPVAPRERGYLAFLGRFSPEKGPEQAIDLALAAGMPLKIAAKIDESQPEYYERVLRKRIDGRFIEYVGEVSEREKRDFLGGAAALVNPIDWPEPFGLVMVEAMACGTPVLTRPVGSVPELVTEGVTGVVRESISDLAALRGACKGAGVG